MPQGYEFYRERAREAAAEAKEATLDNVRERHLRAEKTWRGLADHAKAIALEKEKLQQQKAAQRESEDRPAES